MMSKELPNERPNCREILDNQDKWCLLPLISNEYKWKFLSRKCQSLKLYIMYHLNLKESVKSRKRTSLDDVDKAKKIKLQQDIL